MKKINLSWRNYFFIALVIVIWSAVLILYFYKETVADCVWGMRGFNTQHCTFGDEKADLAGGFISVTDKYPYMYVKRDDKKISQNLVFLYSRDDTRKPNLPFDGTNADVVCRKIQSKKEGEGKEILCANNEYIVLLKLSGEYMASCQELYPQANLLAKKYLGEVIPDCQDIEDVNP